jgi:hypothetical protein
MRLEGGMRAMLILPVAMLFGCANTEGKLQDLSWGAPVKADYATMLERTKTQILKRFPKGLDPDKSNEEKGDFWTVWDYRPSMWYRETTRTRAHVKVEDLGGGNVRIGVAVVKQLNDNIDNPHLIEEARWVATSRDDEMARLLHDSILLRSLSSEPSEYWKERNRTERRTTMRDDLIDRSQDVDLSERPDPRDVKHLDPITGDKKDQ